MLVKELKELLKDLPDDMEVVLDTEENTFTTACKEQSQVEAVILSDEEGEYDEEFFFIRPCTCHVEDSPLVIVEQNPN